MDNTPTEIVCDIVIRATNGDVLAVVPDMLFRWDGGSLYNDVEVQFKSSRHGTMESADLEVLGTRIFSIAMSHCVLDRGSDVIIHERGILLTMEYQVAELIFNYVNLVRAPVDEKAVEAAVKRLEAIERDLCGIPPEKRQNRWRSPFRE